MVLHLIVNNGVFLESVTYNMAMTFVKKEKLNICRSFPVFKRNGKVTYELELQAELAAVHPVYHVTLLKKCMGDPTFIEQSDSDDVKDSLFYEDVPVEILYFQVRRLRIKEVALVRLCGGVTL